MSKHERFPQTRVGDSPGQRHDAPSPATRKRGEVGRTREETRMARLFWIGTLLLLLGVLALGTYQHFVLHAQVIATAKEHSEFVPHVRVAPVRASSPTWPVTLPGTTSAFAAANIYARATGYISRREVDIGDRVKTGQLLAEITAPELDHQISQAEATLAQLKAALQLAQANRDLGSANWARDKPLVEKGWATPQQGDTDRLTLAAQEAAVAVAQANIKQQEAQLQVLHQQKDYQSVVAPFDGVVTQRNVDIGTLVQADATSGTFMFTVMHTDVIRVQVYVPQDAAFGVAPGVEAGIRVPEIPGRVFPGTVTRLANALQPGSRTLLTEIDVPNPDHALTPGSYCLVDLQIPRKTPSLIVPSSAIIFNQDGLSVAVVENGVAHIRHVTQVRDFGTTVEVSAGVREGDQVILNPSVDLAEGRKVAPQATATGAKVS
jgi:RND family efflux transporter MFP subunit